MPERDIPEWIKTAAQYIVWAIGVGLAGMIFLYTNFETVTAADKRESNLRSLRDEDSHRLERIEDMVRELVKEKKSPESEN